MAARILNEEVEHEAWFIELLSKERDGKVRPSGHFRRGAAGRCALQQEPRFLQSLRGVKFSSGSQNRAALRAAAKLEGRWRLIT